MIEFIKRIASQERTIGLYHHPDGGWCLEVDDCHFYGDTPEEACKQCPEYEESP